MGAIRPGPPIDLLLLLRQQFGLRDFVETGTYLGDTAWWAAGAFENVITLEFSAELVQRTGARLSRLPNVRMLAGDSRQTLPGVVSSLTQPALFWLDAHWSGTWTYGQNDECPLLAELKIVAQSPHANFILIDDARFFLHPPPLPHRADQWPPIDQVLDLIRALPQTYYTIVFEDVIMAVPVAAKPLIVQYCQARIR